MKHILLLILTSTILSACSSTETSKVEIPGATPSKHVLENP